jgi:serine/threonine-protein kinase
VTTVTGFGVGLARSAADLMPWQSPEQVLGGPRAASRRSDVHGLGLVLHACLAGENPFEREPDPDVAILSRAAPLLEPLGVPAPLAGVVRRALAVKPGDRFGDAMELARALDAAVPGLAAPAAVAAWSESLFPAGMGMRVLRQRAVDAALLAADHLQATASRPATGPVPLPAPAQRIEPAPRSFTGGARPSLPPQPRPGLRPAPRSVAPVREVEPRPVPRPAPPAAREDDVFVGEFSLAAPPFPHAVRRRNPVDAIEIDVVLPDPPPPLRLPLQPRTTAGGPHGIGRLDIRAGAQGVAAGVAALALGQLRGWP